MCDSRRPEPPHLHPTLPPHHPTQIPDTREYVLPHGLVECLLRPGELHGEPCALLLQTGLLRLVADALHVKEELGVDAKETELPQPRRALARVGAAARLRACRVVSIALVAVAVAVAVVVVTALALFAWEREGLSGGEKVADLGRRTEMKGRVVRLRDFQPLTHTHRTAPRTQSTSTTQHTPSLHSARTVTSTAMPILSSSVMS